MPIANMKTQRNIYFRVFWTFISVMDFENYYLLKKSVVSRQNWISEALGYVVLQPGTGVKFLIFETFDKDDLKQMAA